MMPAERNIHGISVQTLLQTATDPEFRGRMLSLWGLITRACPALGALMLGAAPAVLHAQRANEPITLNFVNAEIEAVAAHRAPVRADIASQRSERFT